ncbi:MAG: hypothetical protein ACTSRZ_04855 [Promethearchaeota archaeon]
MSYAEGSLVINFLKKVWFPAFILIVIFIYFVIDKYLAIYLLIGMIILISFQIIYEAVKTRNFRKYLTKFLRIEDERIAFKLKEEVETIRTKMNELMPKNSKKLMILFIQNKYIAYNGRMIRILKKALIDHEFSTQELLRTFKKYGIETKTELRTIIEELKNIFNINR